MGIALHGLLHGLLSSATYLGKTPARPLGVFAIDVGQRGRGERFALKNALDELIL